jgi:menaquinone-dependent protoporphyrinogen oxidase
MSDHDRVLVAYGSKHHATAEIAEAIAEGLRSAGLQVDVRSAGPVGSLKPYRAVVLGSAVYAARWRPEALRLLRRPELRDRDVWLFSSGPIGEDRGDPERLAHMTKPAAVERIASEIGAHEHVVFGGMVADDAGFIRKKMARQIPPDLRDRRDWAEIKAWADTIAVALGRLRRSAVEQLAEVAHDGGR